MKLRCLLAAVLTFFAAAGTGAAFAAGPVVRFITATDITPLSFRLVWLSNGPATATLRLYEAPSCANEIFTADIVPFPTISGNTSIAGGAQQLGVMSVLAKGLSPDTEYCVQTVTTSLFSSQTTTSPDPALRIRTERRTTRSRAASVSDPNEVGFSNDLARFEITRSVQGADTRGAVLLVKVRGASAPLGAFVGDAIDDDGDPTTHTTLALVDLNNLYGAASHESLDLLGDGTEDIAAWVLGGPEGFITVHGRIVAPDLGLNVLVPPNPCRNAGLTMCDGRLGDANGDGVLTEADAEAVRDFVLGLSPAPPCAVCGDTTWDLSDDMKDALMIVQTVTGLRLLP